MSQLLTVTVMSYDEQTDSFNVTFVVTHPHGASNFHEIFYDEWDTTIPANVFAGMVGQYGEPSEFSGTYELSRNP